MSDRLEEAKAAADAVGVKEIFVYGEATGATRFESLLQTSGEPPEVAIDPAHDLIALPRHRFGSRGVGLAPSFETNCSNCWLDGSSQLQVRAVSLILWAAAERAGALDLARVGGVTLKPIAASPTASCRVPAAHSRILAERARPSSSGAKTAALPGGVSSSSGMSHS